MVARPSVKILFRSSLSILNQLLSVCHGYLQDGMHIVVKYISINYIYKLCVDLECAAGSLLSLRRGSSILSLDWRARCCRFSLYLSPPPPCLLIKSSCLLSCPRPSIFSCLTPPIQPCPYFKGRKLFRHCRVESRRLLSSQQRRPTATHNNDAISDPK